MLYIYNYLNNLLIILINQSVWGKVQKNARKVNTKGKK